jgi:hypothetical protein
MSQDTILTDEADVRYSFNNIRTQGWLNGHTSGLDAAVAWLKEHAVMLFREGKDEAASNLRKLADNMDRALRPEMEERAKRHKKEFPAVIEAE